VRCASPAAARQGTSWIARPTSRAFARYKLDAIARLFKIGVVVQTDVGEPFPDATIERHETGFAFLERLCRLRSVLATDDEQGRLVLTRAGNDRAHDALLQGPGGNV
jgi:prophage tail gpP-like protein